jgi:hypothetical protein
MQYKGGKKETEDHVDSKREPTGADILDDLPYFDFTHSEGQSFLQIDFGATHGD